MSTDSSTQVVVDSRRLAVLTVALQAIPDKLVSVQVDLRPICKGEIGEINAETRRKVEAAHDVLYSAIADLMVALEYIHEWTGGHSEPVTDGSSQQRPSAP